MDHERAPAVHVYRPPLRNFEICTKNGDTEHFHKVSAHLVFNNQRDGEGLVFRRYYDDNVRTEKVAEFMEWLYFKEI